MLNAPPQTPALAQVKEESRDMRRELIKSSFSGVGTTVLVYQLSQSMDIRSVPEMQIKTIELLEVNYLPPICCEQTMYIKLLLIKVYKQKVCISSVCKAVNC